MDVTAWNNDQLPKGGQRVSMWYDDEAIFSDGCDVQISLHIIDVGGFFGWTCALFQSVINASKAQFARHGLPETVISDNGPQFASVEFTQFAKEWQFHHQTSSPLYPESNGRAENAVKTCKTLMKKAKASGEEPLLALLDWRNTPTESIGTSPAQRLMGRRTRTLLPTHQNLLTAEKETKKKLEDAKAKQAKSYNNKCQSLKPLQEGSAIRMRLPDDKHWSLGTCIRSLNNRSYEVKVCGKRYRRNRRHLRATKE